MIFMKQIILKKDKIFFKDYLFVDDISCISKFNPKKIIVTFSQWNESKKILKKKKNVGIQLNSDESVNLIEEDINFFKIIQFNFLTFRDGRPFSEAKKLRIKFNFKNEVRASGHILPDQYIFLLRCGFNSVEIDEAKKEFWIDFLKMDSGLYYQP